MASQTSARTGTRAIVLVALGLVGAGLVGALLMASGWFDRSAGQLPGIAREPAVDVADVVLIDHRTPGIGAPTDLVPPSGDLTLVYFGFLSCPDVCPMTMVDVRRALSTIGEARAERVTMAFITVDPERDDPERMRRYLDTFFAEGRYRAMTAADDDALTAAADRFGVRFEIEPHDQGALRYDVAHTAVLYVVDDRGLIVRELPFGVPSDDIATVLRALL